MTDAVPPPSSTAGSASAVPSTPPLNPPVRPPMRRPNARFMLSHPAHIVALGFGSGLSTIAPGTAGTLWAWLVFLLAQPYLSTTGIGLAIAGALLVGWWACTVTARNMRVADPGNIVWDEVVAFWIVLWLAMPMGFWGQLAAFALFRFFDAVKPGPVAWADQVFKGSTAPDAGWQNHWKGGWGILFDDLVAAFCTLVLLALWRF